MRVSPSTLAVPLLFAAVAPLLLATAPFLAGANAAHPVLSGSMSPTIARGDLAFLSPLERPAASGDIIAFATPGARPTLHRVVEVQRSGSAIGYVTKGDGNANPDPAAVPHERVIGTLAFSIPAYGHLVLLAQSKAGLLVLVVAPALGLLSISLASIHRQQQRRAVPSAEFSRVESRAHSYSESRIPARASHSKANARSDPEPRRFDVSGGVLRVPLRSPRR